MPTIYAVNGKDPVAAWIPSLDTAGNGTTTLTDLSGNGNNGTLTDMDAATDWVLDGGKYALDFDSIDDEVQCGTTLLNGVAAFTYSVWCYQRTSGSFVGVLGKYASTSSDTELILAGSIIIQTVRNGSSVQYRQSSSVLTLNQWQHLVVVFDGSQAVQADRMRIYRNGVSLSLSSNSLPSTVATNASEFRLGSYPGPSGGRINGRIDDIRIFHTALDASDVNYLYNSGTGRGIISALGNPTGILQHNLQSMRLGL